MKKIYGFLTAAAILLTAACTQDLEGPNKVDEVKGDMYMSMQITPSGPIGTRTQTGKTTTEVGKDRENTISTALVIFAEKVSNDYKVVTSVYAGTEGSDFDLTGDPKTSNYMATFKVSRQDLLTSIGTSESSKEFYIFVLANAASEIAGNFGAGAFVQQAFSLSSDANTYWTVDNFLMSNSELVSKTINAADIQPGTHTTATNPYSLGKVKVQRAMSRFDLATDDPFIKFSAKADESSTSDVQNVDIEFDAVALVNMAQTAYSYKVTATPSSDFTVGDHTIAFAEEFYTPAVPGVEPTPEAGNWVYSPKQTAFSTPLFSGVVKDGSLTDKVKNLDSFFNTPAPEDEDMNKKAVNRVGGYTLIENLKGTKGEADETFTFPSDASSTQPQYNIWRYCMENTNPTDPKKQYNGNTTGVIFRAKMTGKKANGENIATNENVALYAYNSVILGTAEDLKAYATAASKSDNDNTGVFNAVKLKYSVVVQKALDANKNDASSDEWTFEDGYKSTGENDWYETKAEDFETSGKYDIHYGKLDDLDANLVKEGFTIYRPTKISGDTEPAQYAYYCYYIYWNRHNDNYNNAIMGIMEFATVRNNVYKLRVSKIHQLGHPGDSDDDPDDPKPDDPNEKDSFYCSIECEILPWVVRVNDIEF